MTSPHPDPGAKLEIENDPDRGSPRAQRIGLIAGALLFLGFLTLPGLPLDPAQRTVAAVTGLVAALWITVAIPVGAAALVPAALFPLLGVMPARQVAPLYLQDLVILFIGAFIVALGLERFGVHRRIALSILARVGARPRSLVLGFMGASAFLSMWINNTATTLMMLPIGLAVVQTTRMSAGGSEEERPAAVDPFAICLLLGMAYSASVGGMGTPVGTAPNQEFLGQLATNFEAAPIPSFGAWFVAWLPLVIAFVLVAWWVMTRWLFRIDNTPTGGAEVIASARAELGSMDSGERRMAGVFLCTAVLWVTRADLEIGQLSIPGWTGLLYRIVPGEQAPNQVSASTVALLMAVLCFVIPSGRKPGDRLMDWTTAKRLPWDVLLLLGGGICIARGFKESGLDQVLGQGIAPWFEGRPDILVVGMVVLFLSGLTEITSNTATTAVLLPVIAQAAIQAGLNPLLLMAPATIAASSAFAMPVATPPNAVVFTSRLIPMGTMARVGIWLNLLMVVLITLVFEFWVRRVWGIESGLPDWASLPIEGGE